MVERSLINSTLLLDLLNITAFKKWIVFYCMPYCFQAFYPLHCWSKCCLPVILMSSPRQNKKNIQTVFCFCLFLAELNVWSLVFVLFFARNPMFGKCTRSVRGSSSLWETVSVSNMKINWDKSHGTEVILTDAVGLNHSVFLTWFGLDIRCRSKYIFVHE